MDGNTKYSPIEITTHNLLFHEDSPILSIDFTNGIMVTSGYDKAIRLWTIKFNPITYNENAYRTASNSSIIIEYKSEIKGFIKPVNCIRFYKGNRNLFMKSYLLAGASDGGKVMVFCDDQGVVIRHEDEDDAYDLVWAEDQLIIGFSSGKVEIYDIYLTTDEESKDLKIGFKLHKTLKIHENTIQGIEYSSNIIATHSLDKTVKSFNLDTQVTNTLDIEIDCSRGLFKRLHIDNNYLYVFKKHNFINVYKFPYSEEMLHKKIGPLNSPIVKVLTYGNLLFITTKKSVYILEDDLTICCIDNAFYMAATDSFFYNMTLFVSSMDGFITTIRLTSAHQ